MQVFLNGEYCNLDEAKIPVLDRGFIFGDAVYEVVRVYDAVPFTMPEHIRRLHASLEAIGIDPAQIPDLGEISRQLLEKNQLVDAHLYWQVTRGVAPRVHGFPKQSPEPTVFVMANACAPLERKGPKAFEALTLPDQRWLRCSIKTTSLLANVLAAQQAIDAECQEAILHRNGVVTECPSRSIFALIDSELFTHPADGSILDSITRQVVIDLAKEEGIILHEKAFSLEEMQQAEELMVVSTTTDIAAVVKVNDKPVGAGEVGVMAKRLYRAFCHKIK